MLDIDFIRKNPDTVKKAAKDKNLDPDIVDKLLAVWAKRSKLSASVQEARAKRNKLLSGIKGKPSADIIKKGTAFKEKLAKLEPELGKIEDQYRELMLAIPNVPAEDVPVGPDSSANVVVRAWGKIPKFSFPIKNHISLAKELDLIDFEAGAKIAGYRGYFLKNEGVLLHLGVMFYALEKLIAKGFIPMVPPVLDKEASFIATGHFPWGKKEAYETSEGEGSQDKRWLAGTAEVPLVSYHSGEILSQDELPKKKCRFFSLFQKGNRQLRQRYQGYLPDS